MQEPHDLVGVPDDVGGKFRRDYEIDRGPVGLLQIEQPPEKSLRQHTFARIPLERKGDELHLVLPLPQLVDQPFADDLGAPAHEGHLGRADGDPHVRARIA